MPSQQNLGQQPGAMKRADNFVVESRLPVLVLAGTASGVGKTSIACGVMAALRAKGLTVQAFKTGPDFIDPMHHQQATGRPSINLDTWMLSREQVLGAFHRAAAGADVAIVEGVMGLFDGRDGATEAGSTAQLAKWLGAPVVLVMDASALARSAAAVAKGYIEFDSELRLGGLLFNKVGGAVHTQWLKDALTAAGITAPVLGGIPKSDSVAVPERHLGLHMPQDASVPPGLTEALALLVSTHVDLDALLELGRTAEVPEVPAGEPTDSAATAVAAAAGSADVASLPPAAPAVRIAVAQDAAFCFYYHDNLALLRASGAELVPFSPLTDPLPADVTGVYLGGGYPEQHAAELAQNRCLRASLAAFARAGGVVYAECGGLIYLSKSIQLATDEVAFPMVGVFPFRTVMGSMRMGYVEVVTQPGCPLFPAGARVRGQVYHYSEIVQESVVNGLGAALSGCPAADQSWGTSYTVMPQIPGAAEVAEGYCQQNVLASYVHLHFGNCPEFAASLVERCRSVDAAAVGAAASEAAHTAAYLESAVASVHTSPQQPAVKNGRAVSHSRSSPDFARDERGAAKQRAAAGAEPPRHYSDEGPGPARYASGVLGGAETDAHHLVRSSTQPPLGAVNGIPGQQRPLSPATTLSKVYSLGSFNSGSPHVGGALPPGEALSPPLSESPQQLSPRELEAQQQHMQSQFFAAGAGVAGAGGLGMVPVNLQQQHQQQQYHYQQQAFAQQEQQQQQPLYGKHYAQQQQQYQQPYANGHVSNGHLENPVPPLNLNGSGRLRAGQGMHNVASWPRLHQAPLPPQASASYGPVSARGGVGACAVAQPPPQQHYYQQQQRYGGAGGGAALAVIGAAGGGLLRAASGQHSRSNSGCFERNGSVGLPGMLPGRSASPLDLNGMERLEPRALALSATPYAWQSSAPPSDKIVSLSPGATEMLWALGLGARVAAVTDACDFPPDVVARAKARRSFAATGKSASYASLDRHAMPASTGTTSASSAATSAAPSRRESPTVGQQRSGTAAWAAHANSAQQGASSASQLDSVDEEVLARERPGLVVYEESPADTCCGGGGAHASGALCDGCGMGQAVLEALVAVGLQQSCRVVCVRRRTLSDILDSMLLVGEAAGVRAEALCTVDRLRTRLRRIAGEAAVAAAAAPARPRVLVLQSLRPLRTVGWWVPDQVTLAGGRCGLEEQAGDPAQELTWEQVQAFAPEVLIIAGMTNGSAMRPLTDLCAVASLPGWWLLPAVRSSAVFVADSALFCRPGPRLVEGVESLARMLWDEDAVPDCSCPERAVLKLSLRPGQRCRPRLLPNNFVPFT